MNARAVERRTTVRENLAILAGDLAASAGAVEAQQALARIYWGLEPHRRCDDRLQRHGADRSAGLTPRQAALLRFIETYCAEHQCSPSTEEMRAALGASSKGNVVRLLDCLEERGAIHRVAHAARSVRVVAAAGVISRWDLLEQPDDDLIRMRAEIDDILFRRKVKKLTGAEPGRNQQPRPSAAVGP